MCIPIGSANSTKAPCLEVPCSIWEIQYAIIGLLIELHLKSENQGLEKLRSVSDRRKMSVAKVNIFLKCIALRAKNPTLVSTLVYNQESNFFPKGQSKMKIKFSLHRQ